MYVDRLGLCLTVLGGVVLLIVVAYVIEAIRRIPMDLKDIEQRTELLNKAEAKSFVNAKDHAALSKVVKESNGERAGTSHSRRGR